MISSTKPSLQILVGADVPADPDSGAAGTVFQMNAALRRLGHHVDEIWQPDMGRRIQHGNLHYLLELPGSYRKAVQRRCARCEYDVIELNQPQAYLAALDHRRRRRPGVFVNRSHGHEVRSEEVLDAWRARLGIKSQQGPRGWASSLLRWLLFRQWNRIAQAADGFLVSCTEDGDFLKNRYRVQPERIGVVTQGVPDLFLTRSAPDFDQARMHRILYIAQLAFFKAPMLLVEAIRLVMEKRSDVILTWVCGSEHHAHVLEMFPSELRDRVTLSDWLPQEKLIDVYDRHGIFLFPSFFEGFGKAPLEAMSRGLCVVASNTGGMRDYVRDGVSGLLVPVGRPDAMADATLALMADPQRCRQMSAAAQQTAGAHTWDRCARDAEEFYRHLMRLKRESNRE